MWSLHNANESSPTGETYRAGFRRGFQVEHTVGTTKLEIMASGAIPALRDLYPGTYVPCTNRVIRAVGPNFTVVEVQYEGETGEDGATDSPENKRAEYVWSDTTSTEQIDKDWDGNPIETAAGEPISGVTCEIADQTLTIVKNYLTFSPWLTHAYRHSTNSDTFVGYAPGTARLVGFSATQQYSEKGTFAYWKVNAKIQFRYPWTGTDPDKAWYARVPHQGYHCLRDGRYVKCVDRHKKISTRPMWLQDDGTQAVDASGNPDASLSNPLFFKKYGSLPYNALGLV